MKQVLVASPLRRFIVLSTALRRRQRNSGNIWFVITISAKSVVREPHAIGLKNRQSIHDRPQAVNDRSEFGHREGDLVICKRSRPLLVIHERKSRMTFIMRMDNKTADETLHCIRSIMDRLNPKARQSMTFDNDMTLPNIMNWRKSSNFKHGSAMLMPLGKKTA